MFVQNTKFSAQLRKAVSLLWDQWQARLRKGSLLLELNKLVSDKVNRLVKGESMEDLKTRNIAIALLQGVTEIKSGAVGATAANGCVWPLLTAIDVGLGLVAREINEE